MTSVILIKYLLLSLMWTFGVLLYFVYKSIDPTTKRMLFCFAPWIPLFLYFMFFWWG